MWIVLLIIHGLMAFLLLGAVTHQLVAVWAPVRVKAGNFVGRFRAVPSTSYVNAIVVLYIVTAIFGGWIYTNYRITARLTLEQGAFWWTFAAFELKEHFVALGLALLPAYWYFWQPARGDENSSTRAMLTTLIALIVWYSFLVGHLTNNIRGLGT
jgi:hypothetical protein